MINKNLTKQRIYFFIFRMTAFLSVLILFFILFYIVIKGAGVINLGFLTKAWENQDITLGGIFPAILGTFLLALLVAAVSIPIGICTAVYLNEYSTESKFTKIVKLTIRNLAGVPSIVYGLFGLSFFVLFLGLGTSLFAASLTLGCMTLPWIITSSTEALKAVPKEFREASLALGATKWQTIKKIVMPSSLSGMLTGSILGISRAMGETAPIILVGATFYISYVPYSVFDKFMALPYHLFILATQHSSPYARKYAIGTALVLILLIFTLNLGIFIIRYKLRRKKEW